MTTLPALLSDDRYSALIDHQRPPAELAPAEADAIRGYLDDSQAANTRAAYRADLADFTAWCLPLGLTPIPASPQTIARYLVALADERGLKVATLTRRLSAISQAHQARGLETPTASLVVRKVFAGIKRRHGTAQDARAPLLPEDLRLMVAQLDESLAGRRDRAMLLLGFAGALRRSELVGLRVEDLQIQRAGLILALRRSKTDQEGEGASRGIPRGRRETCPVRAVEAWLAAAQLASGPLFRPIDRHGNLKPSALAGVEVWRLVKRLAEAVGLDPAAYGGHSLRAGLATAAAAAGAEERDIMRQTGHKSEKMVRRYIRQAQLFTDNAASGLL